MKKLFDEVENFVGKMDIQNQRALPKFSAMHLGAALNEEATAAFGINDSAIQFYDDSEELIANYGLPADWAFTICNLMDSIHFFLRYREKPRIAGLIRNLVFKNYAYKLQGLKRVAFFAIFFANLHYDTPQKPTARNIKMETPNKTLVDKIMDIGNYALEKFSTGDLKNVLEVRIYLAFISLIMADVEIQLNRRNALQISLRYIAKANFDSYIGYETASMSLIGLWDFLRLYRKMIFDSKVKLDRELLEHSIFLLPECKERYHRAICASRFFKFPTSFSRKWLERLRS